MLREEPDVLVLDVRTYKAYVNRHIRGAKSIPLDKLASRISRIDEGTKTIIVHGYDNDKSARASEILARAGYDDVVILDGGLKDWEGPVRDCSTRR